MKYRFKGREAAYAREWYKAHKDRAFVYHLRQHYGLTYAEYRTLLSRGCGICGRRAQQVDHDHKTGRVRGALCKRCNCGLGYFLDGPRLLKKALRYLHA